MVDSDIRMLCDWKKCEVGELNVLEDHVHLVVSVPPKVSISNLMGVLNGAGSLGGTITLDGQNNPDAIFVFKSAGAFNIAALSKIICNYLAAQYP